MLKRFWLGLTQVVTVLFLCAFVLWALKPQWLPTSVMQWLSRDKVVATAPKNASFKPSQAPRNVASLSYHDAVSSALPAVVQIDTLHLTQKAPFNDQALNQLFEQNQSHEPNGGASGGSGVVIDPQGYIVTNYHVIQNAEQIQVTLNDGKRTPATLVGVDPETDLAVLKIEEQQLPHITLGHDDELKVGDVVLAIGNPLGVGQSVTMGIVSGLNRNQLGVSVFENFIQTDAAINHGNSGGALVDSNGHLVGINVAILTDPNSPNEGNIGIGLAIPVSTMQEVAQAIIKTGEYIRGYIGIGSQNISPEMARVFNLTNNDGVIVSSTAPDGPAGNAGIQVGDIIVQLDDLPIKNKDQMLTEVAKLKPGTTATFRLLRNGQDMTISVVIGKRSAIKQK